MASDSLWTGPRTLVFVFFLVALLVVARIVMVFYWNAPLAADELKYLEYSQELQAGYLSKPPLIAWAIASSTSLCGSEATGCVRLLHPLAMGLAGLGVAMTAWVLWKSFAASIWAFALFLTMPLVSLYSQLATTDAWLLLWWSWALCAFVWALSGGGRSRSRLGNANETQGANELAWIVLGIICGLGVLTEYTMVIFFISALVVLLREGLLARSGPWLALLVTSAVVSPNFFWNSEHGFPTLTHSMDPINPSDASTAYGLLSGHFVVDQLFFISPLVLLAFFWVSLKSLFTWGQNTALSRGPGGSPWALNAGARLGLVFAWPLLLLMSFQEFATGQQANFLAPASVGITLTVIGLWCAASNQIFRSRFLGKSLRGIGLPLTLTLNIAFTVVLLAAPWALERLGEAGPLGKDTHAPHYAMGRLIAEVPDHLHSLPNEAQLIKLWFYKMLT